MADVREYGLYIDGKFVDAADETTLESIDPSNGEVVARTARAGRKDARRAIEAGRRAFDDGDWASRSPEARRDALLAVVQNLTDRLMEIGELEARDVGMPIKLATSMSIGAVLHGRELTEMAAKIPLLEPLPHNEFPLPSQNLLVREPYGVVSAIAPFNAPLALTAWKVFPALQMGNSVVLKPSPYTPCTAMELANAVAESDVPPGVFNVLPAGAADVGEELVQNPMVDRVAFTGSTEVGRRIGQLAAPTIKRVTLELGGKGANIFLDDADLDLAVAGSIWGMFMNSGQVCQAGSRLFVPARMAEDVVDRLSSAATQLRLGPTLSWETDLGPVVSNAQLERVERYVELGRKEGATLVCGGHRVTDDELAKGFYFAPTIFADVRNDMRIAQEEIFGPVLCVIPYGDVDEAVRLANDTVFGLTAGVWSRDVPRATAIARRLRAGTVWVNEWQTLITSAPYGGYGQSGLGKELGIDGILEYVQTKHVWIDQGATLKQRVWAPLMGLDRIYGITYDQ